MSTADGRMALVTGAGGGIGRATAMVLAQQGYRVGVFDRDVAAAEQTSALIRQQGGISASHGGDVSKRADVHDGVRALESALGPVDALVNNAGILRTAPLAAITDTDWRDTFAVNLDGVFLCCQHIVPGMVERRRGAVVNMASWVGKRGVPNHAAYSASKFAVIGFTQAIAAEVAPHGVRVNAVCPGIIVDTAMRAHADAAGREQGLADVQTRVQGVPLRRAGVPGDVAGMIAFLLSDAASYVTGQAMDVSGGLWMG